MEDWCQTSSPELNVGEWRLVSKADLETFQTSEFFPFGDPGEFELGLWPICWRDLQSRADRDTVNFRVCVLSRRYSGETNNHNPLF